MMTMDTMAQDAVGYIAERSSPAAPKWNRYYACINYYY